MGPIGWIARRPFARGIVASLVAAALGLPAGAGALDSPARRATLTGISSVYVFIEDLQPEAEQDGLTTSQLQTDVESRLRQAGITVAPPFEGYLYVRVNAMRQPSGSYAVAVNVEFRQLVTLMRDPTLTTFAGTWNADTVATVGASRVRDVRAYVAELVDQFIAAYLEQNPKQ